MKLKLISLLTILNFVCIKLTAQTTITFVILDNLTGKKITQIDSISLHNTKDSYNFKNSKTSNGQFLIKNVKASNYQIEIFCNGYNKFEKDIKITYANNQRFFCRLNPLQTISNTSQDYQEFIWVQEMPEYPGGDTEMLDFLKKNINKNIGKDFQGTVYVQFIVDTNGKVDSIEILKCDNVQINTEIIRVFNLMPIWKPGRQSGIAVNVKLIVPVKYGN